MQLVFYLTSNTIFTTASEYDWNIGDAKNKTSCTEKIPAREADISQNTKPRATRIEKGGRDSNLLEKHEKEKRHRKEIVEKFRMNNNDWN